MQSKFEYQRSLQYNLRKLKDLFQPRYLIYIFALAGLADIAQNASSGAATSIIGTVGGTIGVNMLAYLLTKLEKNETVDSGFVEKFCKTLDESGIERWLTRSDLHEELNGVARAIGTALQYHENSVVNRLLNGVSYYEKLRAKTIDNLAQNIIDRFDPEKRYLALLIQTFEAREGIQEYVNLQIQLSVKYETSRINEVDKRRLVDPALAERFDSEPHYVPPSIEEHREIFQNIHDVLDKYKCFVLLGDPGSGKTTTLRRLIVDLAWSRMRDTNSPIPLFLDLSQWKAQTLDDFLKRGWNLDIDILAATVQDKLWVFLDGLNEMGSFSQQNIKALRSWLQGRNRPEHIIISCRTVDYKDQPFERIDAPIGLGITTVKIIPLDEASIREFTGKYLTKEKAEAFLKYIVSFDEQNKGDEEDEEEKSQLFLLTRNPFMLRALILLYEDSPDGNPPSNIGMLFQSLVRYLWTREQHRNTVGWIEYELMLNQLSALAYYMLESNSGTSTNISEVGHFVDSSALEAMERAAFLEIANEQVRFNHQMLQEYFAAVKLKFIVKATGSLPEQSIQPNNIFNIDLRVFDLLIEGGPQSLKSVYPSKWAQVIIALCGISDNVEHLVLEITEKNPFLVVDCLLSGISISEATSRNVKKKLLDFVVDSDYWGHRFWIAGELARYGYAPETIEQKVYYFAGLMEWKNCRALGPDAISTLLKLAKKWSEDNYYDEGVKWCLEEMDALGDLLEKKLLVREPGILGDLLNNNEDLSYDLVEKLRENALFDLYSGLDHWNSDVREGSAELIEYLAEVQVGITDPQIISKLIKCLKDKSWFVAKAAAYSLWRIGTDEAIKSVELFWRTNQSK